MPEILASPSSRPSLGMDGKWFKRKSKNTSGDGGRGLPAGRFGRYHPSHRAIEAHDIKNIQVQESNESQKGGQKEESRGRQSGAGQLQGTGRRTMGTTKRAPTRSRSAMAGTMEMVLARSSSLGNSACPRLNAFIAALSAIHLAIPRGAVQTARRKDETTRQRRLVKEIQITTKEPGRPKQGQTLPKR